MACAVAARNAARIAAAAAAAQERFDAQIAQVLSLDPPYREPGVIILEADPEALRAAATRLLQAQQTLGRAEGMACAVSHRSARERMPHEIAVEDAEAEEAAARAAYQAVATVDGYALRCWECGKPCILGWRGSSPSEWNKWYCPDPCELHRPSSQRAADGR